MRKNQSVWWKNILSASFIGALIGSLTPALEGIIGNRADMLFTLAWPFIQETVTANLWPWCTMILFLLGYILIYMHFIRRSRIAEHTLTTDHKILSLDDSLLRRLASWIPSLNTEKDMKRFFKDVLLDAIAKFDGQVHRAALLLPDASGEYLYCWANYQMSEESIDSMKFYIGSDQDRRHRESGVAGEVFLTGELQVGHLQQIKGIWICEDCPNYINFPGRRPFPPYLSFVNLPLIGIDPNVANSSSTTCLGVICFDSTNKDVFDSKESQLLLRTLARRITAALLIFKLYQNPPLPPTQGNGNP